MLKSMVQRVLRKELKSMTATVSQDLPEGLKALLQGQSDVSPLTRQQFKIESLNDLRDGALANVTDATINPHSGNTIRHKARRKRLRHWNHFLNEFDESKRDRIAATLEKFEVQELKRMDLVTSELTAWRTRVNGLNPHVAPKEQPFYVKWFKDSPEKGVAKLLAQQLNNEKELIIGLKKIDTDVATQLNDMLKGTTSILELMKQDGPKTEMKEQEQEQEDLTDAIPDIAYVMEFKGDSQASQVMKMKEEISVLLNLNKTDRISEVILKLHSPGGSVYGYGLAEAELSRIKQAGIKLTVCVDEVAASGGYMMAVVADQIVCSPWSIVGSIGVLSGMPNVANRMDQEGLKFYKLTAGENKNTLDPFTTPTEEGLAHVQTNMERILALFSDHVETHRKNQLTKSISEIATGDTWQGIDALELGLVDVLQTSEAYVHGRMDDGCELYSIEKLSKKQARSPWQKLMNQNKFVEDDGLIGSLFGSSGGMPTPMLK